LAARLEAAAKARAAPPTVTELTSLGDSKDSTPAQSETRNRLLTLARTLQGHINQLPPMRSGAGAIAVGPLPNAELPFWAPLHANVPMLHSAIELALATPPYQFTIVGDPKVRDESPSVLKRAAQASGAEMLLLYGFELRDANAHVRLVAYDATTNQVHTREATFDRETKLIEWRTLLLFGTAMGLFWFLVALYIWIVWVGSVTVEIEHDGGVEKEVVCVALTRSSARPKMGDPEAFLTRMANRGARERGLIHTHVKSSTTFSRVRPGSYTAHVYGAYRKSEVSRPFADTHSQRIEVAMRRETALKFDLDPKMAEFFVTVIDGQSPVPGALVFADGVPDARVMTDRSGNASLMTPHGKHMIQIEARDIVAQRQYEVRVSKGYRVKIDLVRERRAKAIALSEDDFKFPAMVKRDPKPDPDSDG
jgi:hypothetical protein